ncbi:hypothetical protein HCN44_007346 [Aphidius gifuensis]|uniref:Uncharacterized protein n=1 Tax=Aphidius gifuensis TaxID=684658 RepID=A0A834XLR6_APHGI|nr:putative uncharacterized protein DDB_G0277255 [Aphidius gifuensis]KAF7989036.1 hypothetical protein HCN44_007346 [Aphidius gifuensis]
MQRNMNDTTKIKKEINIKMENTNDQNSGNNKIPNVVIKIEGNKKPQPVNKLNTIDNKKQEVRDRRLSNNNQQINNNKQPEMTNQMSSQMTSSYPGCIEAMRQARAKKNSHIDPSFEILFSYLPDSVIKQHDLILDQWWNYCSLKSKDPLDTDLLIIIDFLDEKSKLGSTPDDLKSIASTVCLIASDELRRKIYLTGFLCSAFDKRSSASTCENTSKLSTSSSSSLLQDKSPTVKLKNSTTDKQQNDNLNKSTTQNDNDILITLDDSDAETPSISPKKTTNSTDILSDNSQINFRGNYAYLQKAIDNPHTTIVQKQVNGNTVEMLVVQKNGEQKLMTLSLPNEECTVDNLLEQAGIPVNDTTTVSFVEDPLLKINYIVETDTIVDTIDTNYSSDKSSQDNNIVIENNDNTINTTTSNIEQEKKSDGKLAICNICGLSSRNFNNCYRCKRNNNRKDSISSQSSTQQQQQQQRRNSSSIDVNNKTNDNDDDCNSEKIVEDNRKRKRSEPETVVNKKRKTKSKVSKKARLEALKLRKIEKKKKLEESMTSCNEESHDKSMTDASELNDTTTNDEAPLSMHFPCHSVSIGSYKYIADKQVSLSQSGLHLSIPLLHNNSTHTKICIDIKDITKVKLHTRREIPALFFYTNTKIGNKIRNSLGMTDKNGSYYDPDSNDESQKLITLLPTNITRHKKKVLQNLFGPNNLLETLPTKQAKDLLMEITPKGVLI